MHADYRCPRARKHNDFCSRDHPYSGLDRQRIPAFSESLSSDGRVYISLGWALLVGRLHTSEIFDFDGNGFFAPLCFERNEVEMQLIIPP